MISDKPRFLRRLPILGNGKLTQIQTAAVQGAMLLSVDEQIAAIVDALDDEGQLENTYLIFTSDNGYFAGEHRIRQGKYLPHEPSSHVPMLIRGPGIPAGAPPPRSSRTSTSPRRSPRSPRPRRPSRTAARCCPSPRRRAREPPADRSRGRHRPGIDDDGAETPAAPGDAADATRVKSFHKKLKAKKRKLSSAARGCTKSAPAAPCSATTTASPTSTRAHRHHLQAAGPRLRGLRTERYLLVLYGTGELDSTTWSETPSS